LTRPSEQKTRKGLIDPELTRAGWNVSDPARVGLEIPVDGFDPAAWQHLQQQFKRLREADPALTLETPVGVSDYVLYRANGEIIAVVEAKRTSIDPRLAEAQAEFYVTELEKRQSFRPFAFLANGYDIYFLEVGRAAKRLVQGFFSPADLENLLFLRTQQTPLNLTPINPAIVNRGYQIEAIRRVGEAFALGKRKALVVMATGTGKTRVAMALVDIFLRSNQARRILFVADRDALVGQALKEGFRDHIPGEPCTRLRSYQISTTSRLYVVTLQTLSNIFRQFSPAFFDLIAFDEVHRSIFNKWNDVLHYFDARMIGLTATPADFIDRNTFLEFECFDGKPTFLYTLRDAVKEGYLVDYTLYAAQTRFQRQGIRGVDLGEEQRNLLIAQGLDPDAIDFSGTELERKVTNRDTLRQQWLELMEVIYKDASGQLPAKTIIFAMTQEHALRLAEVFAELYPQFPGLVQVITYKSDFHSTLIDRFKTEDLPRIAISVDMLETGVNVPEVCNLVFMRPVQSRIKLEQMIGRGTRTQETCKRLDWLPNGRKDDFLIVDFWENDFSKTPQPEVAQSLPVLVNLFNTRLALLEQMLGGARGGAASGELRGASTAEVVVRERVIADLRAMVEQIPRDAFAVKRVLPQIEQVWTDEFWRYLPPSRLEFLRLNVGPLLRYAADVDVAAATFTHKVERLKLQRLTGQPTATMAQAIAEDAARLPDFVREDPARAAAIQRCLAGLASAPLDQMSQVIDALAGQMRFRRQGDDLFLTLDLPDLIASRGYILLFGGSQEVYVESYRRQVEAHILDLVAGHPTIAAIERGEPVTDAELVALERTLRQALGGPGLEVTEENIRKAYGLRVGSLLEFVRALLEIDGIPDYQAIVQRQFDGFIGRHDEFNADQVRFLRAVQSVFVQQRRLARVDLYRAPLDAFGRDAVERLFAPAEVEEVLQLTGQLEIG